MMFHSRHLTDRAFEQTGGLAQLPLNALEVREFETSPGDTHGVIEPLGYPDSLLSVSVSLVEHTAFGEGAREVGLSHDCGEHYEAEPLTGRLVVYHVHQFPAGMFGPAIVAREIERSGKVILSRDLERGVAETLCDGLNPFRRGAHLRDVTARVHVMAAHIGRHPSEPSRVVEAFWPALRLLGDTPRSSPAHSAGRATGEDQDEDRSRARYSVAFRAVGATRPMPAREQVTASR